MNDWTGYRIRWCVKALRSWNERSFQCGRMLVCTTVAGTFPGHARKRLDGVKDMGGRILVPLNKCKVMLVYAMCHVPCADGWET
jgi:hypothetical protein